LPHQDRLNIAVFIDFDNIEIGVKSTLNEHFDVGIVLDGIKERGEVVTKIAYADWTRAGEYSRHLTQHAIRLVQRNLTPGGDKNGADINLALDALEMVFTHQHINAYVIVGGDSDFLSLVEKLKQYDKKVFVVGGRAFTSVILQRNCHEFIAYENLNRSKRPAAVQKDRPVVATAVAPISQAFPIVRRALKILSDREVSPQTGLLKSTLLQLDSTFSERNYGASSFLDFVEKLAQAGLVQLKHAGRSVMVELNGVFSSEGEPPAEAAAEAVAQLSGAGVAPVSGSGAAQVSGSGAAQVSGSGAAQVSGSGVVQVFRPATQRTAIEAPAGPQVGTNADGVKLAGQILKNATTARWPMYVRNVKQLLRAHRSDGHVGPNGDEATGASVGSTGFDERQYGFGGLMDLLRACQKEGLLRVERDRRGGLRVFPGPALQRTDLPQAQISREPAELQAVATEPAERTATETEHEETEHEEIERIPVDTTAELLGRANAKPRRPRGQPSRVGSSAPRGTRKAAAAPRKPAARRTPRASKAPRTNAADEGNK
jgi:uncharacterized LabA/DUF88 family protein